MHKETGSGVLLPPGAAAAAAATAAGDVSSSAALQDALLYDPLPVALFGRASGAQAAKSQSSASSQDGSALADPVGTNSGGPANSAVAGWGDVLAGLRAGRRAVYGLGGPSDVWTEAETLKLLEGVDLYRDKWEMVAANVGTKDEMQCALHFVAMPVDGELLAEMGYARAALAGVDEPIEGSETQQAMNDEPELAASVADAVERARSVVEQFAALHDQAAALRSEPEDAPASKKRCVVLTFTRYSYPLTPRSKSSSSASSSKRSKNVVFNSIKSTMATAAQLMAAEEDRKILALAAEAIGLKWTQLQKKVERLEALERKFASRI